MSTLEKPHPEISGRTRILGILAHPTDQVKAPPEINRIARSRGKDAVMVPFNIAPADLAGFIGALRMLQSFDGAIVTVPHKQAILPLCDVISQRAAAVGAANIFRRSADGHLVGDQLDGIGFVNGLTSAGIGMTGKSVYLVGAGGAAHAIAFALADAGISRLTLANRTVAKAEDLCRKLQIAYPDIVVSVGHGDPSGHDLVINGTTLGMRPDDELPLDVTKLDSAMIVAEVIMEPEITALLAAATSADCRVHRGKHMLEHQLHLMADYLGL